MSYISGELGSSSSSGSDEGQHPLDAVIASRAGSSGRLKEEDRSPPGGNGQDDISPSQKRRRERSPSSSPKEQPKRGRSGSLPESGEILGSMRGDHDTDEDIDYAIPSSSSAPISASEDSSADDEGSPASLHDNLLRRPPSGVILLADEDDDVGRTDEMRRLLRQPRYFDPDFEEGGVRCFKCGGRGHMARDCTNAATVRPCYLCAAFGHDSKDCPSAVCWKCQRAGHQAKACPHTGSAAALASVPKWDARLVQTPTCLQCGKEDCPCAGQLDFVRAEEGKCAGAYMKGDLKRVTCLACGLTGHLCCALTTATAPKASCHNCGESGHLARECWRDQPRALRAELALEQQKRGKKGKKDKERDGGRRWKEQQEEAPRRHKSDRGRWGGDEYTNSSRRGNKSVHSGSRSGRSEGHSRDGGRHADRSDYNPRKKSRQSKDTWTRR
jgi:cellular nucleic acid-binding protein